VPAETPGVNILRDISTMADPEPHFRRFGGHSEILYENVRVPYDNLLGREGDGFVLAQKRLGPGASTTACAGWARGGGLRHALRAAVSRYLHGSYLAEKQTIQNWVATRGGDAGGPAADSARGMEDGQRGCRRRASRSR